MKARLEKLFMVLASGWGIIRILILRPKVVIFGGDRIGNGLYDPRMARVYEWLLEKKVLHIHLIHAAPNGRVIRNWLRRPGPIVYLEGLALYGNGALLWLLKKSGAKQLWGIDDFRHWPKVVSAARQVGMKGVLFQHGRFTRHQSGVAFPDARFPQEQLPDLYIVWNEYWREKLLKLSPAFAAHANRVVIGGAPSAAKAFSKHLAVSTGEPLQLIVVHEPAAVSADMRHLLDLLLGLEDVTVFYKVRNDQQVSSQLGSLGLQGYPAQGLQVVFEIPERTQLVLGSYSTLLYETIARGVPVGVVQMSSTQADDLTVDGLAAAIDLQISDLREQLVSATQISPEELARRASRLTGTADIKETLNKLLNV